jgi:hypothetical protein
MKSRSEFQKLCALGVLFKGRLERVPAIRNSIFLSVALFVILNHLSIANKAQKKANEDELNNEFALKNGPRFILPDQQRIIVDRVIDEMKKGYGGTLVTTKGMDKALDSSAFLSRYLREFSSLEKNRGLKEYDYRFERILARASEYPVMLDDPRLDWDIYRSLLLYEQFSDGTDVYESGQWGESPSLADLDSAKDLAWMYIDHHADGLMKDKNRQKWWIDHLARGLNEPGRRRVNRWILFQLCVLADPNRRQQPQPTPDDSRKTPMRKPSAEDPFLVVKADTKPPAFEDALHMIAGPLGLSFEVWGIDPRKQPPARILAISLEMAKWPTDKSFIIGQESWSKPEEGSHEWGVYFFHLVGRRASYSNFHTPEDRKDGVFFFTFNKRLYVWPKAEMDDGLLQMLYVEGLIDHTIWMQLVEARGLHRLKKTLTGN